MSLTISVRTSSSEEAWSISRSMMDVLTKLDDMSRAADDLHARRLLSIEIGGAKRIPRQELIKGVNGLLHRACFASGGFEVRAHFPFDKTRESVSRGLSGLSIGGKYFTIKCSDDSWRIRPVGTTISRSPELPVNMQGEPRFDEADIQTANCGIVKVRSSKKYRAELVRTLESIRSFLEGQSDDDVEFIMG
jgi:hypothetical protein